MLNLKIAYRFLIKKPIQTIVGFLIVAIGVAIFYFVLNSATSLKQIVFNTTAETQSHIMIMGNETFGGYEDEKVKSFRNALFQTDSRVNDVAYTYTLFGNYKTLSKNNKGTQINLTIKGVDFEYSKNIQHLGNRIGDFEGNKTPNTTDSDEYFGEAVIGLTMAKRLKLETDSDYELDQFIDITISDQTYKFKVTAIYSTSIPELAANYLFTTIETAQKISGLNIFNGIDIRTKNPLDSSQALEKIQPIIDRYYPDFVTIDWQQGNRYAVNALYIEDVSLFIIQIFTALTISFGITAIISFMVRDRINQIGILKALGLKDKDVSMIVLYKILLITIPSIFIGLYLGNFFSIMFMKIFLVFL